MFLIVGVAGAVNVRVVALLGLILDVRRVDRDSAGLLFRRLVDFVVTHSLRLAEGGQHHRDGSGQGRFAVVNDGANVDAAWCAQTFASPLNNPSSIIRVISMRPAELSVVALSR